jgi:hypothetical protein
MSRKTSGRTLKLSAAVLFLLCFLAPAAARRVGPHLDGPASKAPRYWDDAALAGMDVPLADPHVPLVHARAGDYYQIPPRQFVKTYPIYAPGKEPPGYMDWLKQQDVQLAFDATKLSTDADWIAAGEAVFEAPITINSHSRLDYVRDPEWYRANKVPVTADGIMPFYRYIIRKKGTVEIGEFSCAMCHTRVMPDGAVIKGAQGNFPFDRVLAYSFRAQQYGVEKVRVLDRILFAAPWAKDDPNSRISKMSFEEIAAAHEAIPPGVMTRFGTSLFYPPQVPDLIGVKDRKYLDHTGLVRQRTIEDLMRYSAINQGGDVLDHFGDFSPVPAIPNLANLARYSDEEAYALALYLYSLAPPPNPNKFGALAARGQRIFESEGCSMCHTPPLYTSNKLTPAEGFTPRPDSMDKLDIIPICLGTDPNLALNSRRGTGYYKIPSLKGVWYRGPFEHNGSVATLEDWFDPRRLRDDYVPTGFKGYGSRTRVVKGHRFGLDLAEPDRKALIAFLKTL